MADDNALASCSLAPFNPSSAYLLTLSIKQICGQSTLLDSSIVLLLDIPLVVRLELLLHLNLFRVSLGVMQLGLVTKHLLRIGRCLVSLSGCSLSSSNQHGSMRSEVDLLLLLVIHPTTVTSSMLVHVVILIVRQN